MIERRICGTVVVVSKENYATSSLYNNSIVVAEFAHLEAAAKRVRTM